MKCCGLKYLYKTMSSRGGPGGVFRMRDLSVARRKECEISSYGCDGTITLDYYDEEFRIFVQAAAVLIVRIGEYRIARRSNYLMRKDDEKKIVVSGFCLCRSVVYDLDGARSRENDRA